MAALSPRMRRVLRIGAAIIVTGLVIVQLGLIGASAWLNSAGGQDFIRTRINAALEENGYTLAYDHLSYMPLNGLAARDIRIADAQGPLADIDTLALRVNLMPLFSGQASGSVTAGNVILHRLPQAQDDAEESAPLAPFTLPDLFFNRFALSNLDIDRLDIREDVMGMPMQLGVTLHAAASLADDVDASVRLRLRPLQDDAVAWLPERLRARILFDPRTLAANLRSLAVTAPGYAVTGKGDASLAEGGAVNLGLSIKTDDLETLTGQQGRAHIDAQLTGETADPVLRATGVIALDALKDNALSDINMTLEARSLAQSPAGTLALDAAYKDMPLTAQTAFAYAAPALALTGINITGPDLLAQGDIDVDTATLLATGDLRISADDLATYAALLDQDMAGALKADIRLAPGDTGAQGLSLDADIARLRYDTYTVESATIKTALADIAHYWPHALDLTARNARITGTLSVPALKARLEQRGDNDYRLTLDAAVNTPAAITIKGGATLAGLAAGAPAANDIDLNIGANGSTLRVTGSADAQQADITANARGFALASLPASLPDGLARATLTGEATLKGLLAAPQIAAQTTLTVPGLAQATSPVSLDINGGYAEGRAQAALNGRGNGIQSLTGQASLPVTLALYPFSFDLPQGGPLSGNINARLDARAVGQMLLPPDNILTGPLRVDATLSGTASAPGVAAAIALDNGTYRHETYGVNLRDITLAADADAARVTIRTLTARDDGAGRINAGGVIGIDNPALTDLVLRMDNVHLLKSDMADGTANMNLRVTGKSAGYTIGGDVRVATLSILIPERFQSNIPELNIVRKGEKATGNDMLAGIDLAIDVDAPNQLFVRGWGLDAEFGGRLAVTGTLAAPLVNGTLGSIRGRYEEFGKLFTLDNANLRFQGEVPPSPYLDIKATTQTGDIAASVLLTGPVSKPAIAFASTPSLPEDEVMSHILFGKDMSRITPFQAIQLTQTLQRLSGRGGGGFNPVGMLREATGLDDIRVDLDEDGGTSVGAGKYLSDKVYLEIGKGAGATSGAASLKIEMTPSLSLESKIGQDAQGGAGIFWSKDY